MTIDLYSRGRANFFTLEALGQKKKKDRDPLPGESSFATMAVNHFVGDHNKIIDGAMQERRELSAWGKLRLRRLDTAIARIDNKQRIGFHARSDQPGPALFQVSGQDMGGLLNTLGDTHHPVVMLGSRPEDFYDDYYPRTEVEPGVWRISDPDRAAILWLLDGETDPGNLTFTRMAASLSPVLAKAGDTPVVLSSAPVGPDLLVAVCMLRRPGRFIDTAASKEARALQRAVITDMLDSELLIDEMDHLIGSLLEANPTIQEDIPTKVRQYFDAGIARLQKEIERFQDLLDYGLASMEDTILSLADPMGFHPSDLLQLAAARAAEKPHVFHTEAVVQVEYLTGPEEFSKLGRYRKSNASLIPVPGSAGEILYDPFVIKRLNALEEERRMRAWRDLISDDGLVWDEREIRDLVQREIAEAPWQAIPGALTTSPEPGYTLLTQDQLRHLAATAVCRSLYDI